MILKYRGASNSGPAVRALGLLMGKGPVDNYTVELKTAVKGFQRARGLTVDGIAGPETLKALVGTLPEARYGDCSGSVYVRAAQALVSVDIDGKYGNKTRAAVADFQRSAGLAVTGNVDGDTWLALWELPRERAGQTATPVRPVDYKQYDARWGSVAYSAVGNASQTIRSSGCGPTAMADILATWVDGRITPRETAKWALEHGYRTPANGTAWEFFGAIAKAYGFARFTQTKSMAAARSALREGALVVASMGPGYWTKGGHYICLWKADDAYMYANDPASSVRKKQKLAAFEKQRKQFFIFWKREG